MIEVLTGFPDYVAAYRFRKNLTKADLRTVLIPLIEDKLSRHRNVRLYWDVAPDFVGLDHDADWEDTKFGFSHFFGNAALVTDEKWLSRAMNDFFGVFMPGKWRVFSTTEADKAREWVITAR